MHMSYLLLNTFLMIFYKKKIKNKLLPFSFFLQILKYKIKLNIYIYNLFINHLIKLDLCNKQYFFLLLLLSAFVCACCTFLFIV